MGWALQAGAVGVGRVTLEPSRQGRAGLWNIPVLWKSHSSALAEFGRARVQFPGPAEREREREIPKCKRSVPSWALGPG